MFPNPGTFCPMRGYSMPVNILPSKQGEAVDVGYNDIHRELIIKKINSKIVSFTLILGRQGHIVPELL